MNRIAYANDSMCRLPPVILRSLDGGSGAANSAEGFGLLYGVSPEMQVVYGLIEKVAPTDATVFVVGESGCGKELVAHTIHRMSSRSDGPFVAVNCGALPSELIEAELFGYEKGAFTGALRQHRGFFERASGGTLFLDEITEMAPDMQVRLLRVLDAGTFNRVGGDSDIPVNVRVIAATNRDPAVAVEHNHLREDLMYRLAVFPIQLPPLRQRGEDVILLARHFLDDLNREVGTGKRFSEKALEEVRRHAWPGNVRELKNCVQRAFILADDMLEPQHLVALPRLESSAGRNGERLQFAIGTSLTEMERQTIFATLDHYSGNKKRTAESLGVSLKTLYNRLTEYAVPDGNGDMSRAKA